MRPLPRIAGKFRFELGNRIERGRNAGNAYHVCFVNWSGASTIWETLDSPEAARARAAELTALKEAADV